MFGRGDSVGTARRTWSEYVTWASPPIVIEVARADQVSPLASQSRGARPNEA
jgi:hypothetical protein